MRQTLILTVAVALAAALTTPVAAGSHIPLSVTAAKAPVAPDGTAAGAVTDFVLTFADRDPAVDGIGMVAGGTVEVRLPKGFVDTGDGNTNTAIILQGWPQSPPFPFIWDTTVSGNLVTATLNADYPVGAFGPGPKQFHLLLSSFRNPGPGTYRVPIMIRPDPASPDRYFGAADVLITPMARPSIEVVSVFSGGGPPPPFNNPFYQTIAAGDPSLDVGLYLWDAGSSVVDGVFNAYVDVALVMSSPSKGRLIQAGETVGVVDVSAPAGAHSYALVADGPSVLGLTAVTGFETGIMVVHLETDPDVTGTYVVTLSMNQGNQQVLRITAE